MLLIYPVNFVTRLTFIELLRVQFLPLARIKNLFFARSVGEILHVNYVMIVGVRRKERIVVVWWTEEFFPREGRF